MQMTLAEVLGAYTYGASKALRRHSASGTLTQGEFADFIALKPSASLFSLFYSVGSIGGHEDVIDHTYIAGRPFKPKKNLRSIESR